MHLVTSEQMRELDRTTIDRLGIPAVALMENAGRAIAEEIIEWCRRRDNKMPESGLARAAAVSGGAGQAGWVQGAGSTGGAIGALSTGSAQGASQAWSAGNVQEASQARDTGGGQGMGFVQGVDGELSAGSAQGASQAWSAGSAQGSGEARYAGVAGSWSAGGRQAARQAGEAPGLTGFAVSGDRALTLDTAAAEHWLVLVGKGNNGGDGLVAARHLREAGIAVTLVYAVPPESLTGEAALQRDAAAALGLSAVVYGRDRLDLAACSGILDALLGTGTAGAPRGAYAELIAAANASGKPIVSADIPSGLNADTGETHEPCIHAAVTVCLAFLKRGLLQYPGAGAAGTVVVRSIGIPAALAREAGLQSYWLTPKVLQDCLGVDVLRRRTPEGHKGTYGHVLVAGGTLGMSGAGLLAARAALRAGSGLVTWALPHKLLPAVIGAAPELMLADAGGDEQGNWNAGTAAEVLRLGAQRDVTAVGPGLGRFQGDTDWLRTVWEGTEGPLVIDADALNILAEADYDLWATRRGPVILTPHPGEMARLAGIPASEVQRDRMGLAERYARKHGITLVLKGAHTVIATPDGQSFVNTTGHPGMGTGGAGDVLTGIIAGLLAQGLNAVQGAAFGVYLHGLAGEHAAILRNSPASLTAGDIIEAL